MLLLVTTALLRLFSTDKDEPGVIYGTSMLLCSKKIDKQKEKRIKAWTSHLRHYKWMGTD
jgi:hypothetical protein